MKTDIPGKKRALYALIIAFLCLALLAALYMATVWVRGARFYAQVKHGATAGARNGYRGDLMQYDAALGYTGKPGGAGGWLIARGDPVASRNDADGLRVPVAAAAGAGEGQRPRLLFLGDSFTYGQLVAAEDAFAWKAAARLGGTAINAGVPGYSLAQMTVKAAQLVPKYKPDYVVVQYSPWLVERALSEFAPSIYPIHIPVPYYSRGDADVVMQPPLFRPGLFSIPEIYWRSPPSFQEKVSFIINVAQPAIVWDDSNMAWLRVKQWLGFAERPSSDQEAVVRSAYRDINRIAQDNGARLIIVVLGFGEEFTVPGELFPPHVYGVNAYRAMTALLPEKTLDSYAQHYWLSRGNPPQPVDSHPNEQAHAVIAEALAQRVRMAPPLP